VAWKRWAAGGGLLLLALWFWWRQRSDERPPIRVKNKKLAISTEKDWKKGKDEKHWKPDHPDGKDVDKFHAIASNGSISCCLTALDELTLTVDTGIQLKTLRFYKETNSDPNDPAYGRVEPLLESTVDLKHDSGSKSLKLKSDKDVHVTGMRTRDGQCDFPYTGETVEIEIQIVHKNA
jgi:hypothetical protein